MPTRYLRQPGQLLLPLITDMGGDMAKLWAAILALLGVAAASQPADVRQWEAEVATAMAYAACLRVDVTPTPQPDRNPDGRPAPAKPVAKPAAKPTAKATAPPVGPCVNGVCSPSAAPYVPVRRGLFRR